MLKLHENELNTEEWFSYTVNKILNAWILITADLQATRAGIYPHKSVICFSL